MPRLGLGIGVDLSVILGERIDQQALAHYNRVIADGGVIPAGLSGCNAFFVAVKAVYNITNITTSLAAAYDPHYLGYKSGAGSGATLGQASQKLYSACGVGGDLLQATAASQPLLLEHSGTNYYFMSRASGNSITANGGVSYTSATDTLTITARIFLNNQGASGTFDTIISQGTLYALQVTNAGTNKSIRILGSAAATASTAYTPSTTAPHWVKAVITPTEITYSWSEDNVTYTNLGTSTLPTFGSGTTFTIGGTSGSTTNVTSCYYVEVTNSTTLASRVFNPASYNASTSQTSWTSTTGEVWTINTGTATTGYKGVLVDRTIAQGDGIDDVMQTSAMTSYTSFTRYAALKVFTAAASQRHFGGSTTQNTHILFGAGSGLAAFNGAQLNFTGTTLNLLRFYTINYNTTSSSILLNNASQASGNLGSNASTARTLFASGISTLFGNSQMTTLIDSISADSANNTAMFNALKQFNNNAF